MKARTQQDRIFNFPNNEFTAALLDAGILTLIPEPEKRSVKWAVFQSERDLKLYISAQWFSERQMWTGPNAIALANKHLFHGEAVPPAIAEEYERLRRKK